MHLDLFFIFLFLKTVEVNVRFWSSGLSLFGVRLSTGGVAHITG